MATHTAASKRRRRSTTTTSSEHSNEPSANITVTVELPKAALFELFQADSFQDVAKDTIHSICHTLWQSNRGAPIVVPSPLAQHFDVRVKDEDVFESLFRVSSDTTVFALAKAIEKASGVKVKDQELEIRQSKLAFLKVVPANGEHAVETMRSLDVSEDAKITLYRLE